MSLINNSIAISTIEWAGVASSLTGSVLNAHGRRCSFIFWTLSTLLLGVVGPSPRPIGLAGPQGAGVAINLRKPAIIRWS